MVIGPHVHLDVPGYGIRFACPPDGQSVVVPRDGAYSVVGLLEALLSANSVTGRLRFDYLLGV